MLKGRLNVTHRPALSRQETLDDAGQVPTCPFLAELDDPRPYRRGPSGHREGTVHHDVRLGDDVVARPDRSSFGRRGGDGRECPGHG